MGAKAWGGGRGVGEGGGALAWVRDRNEHYLPRPLLLTGTSILAVELLAIYNPCSNSFFRFGYDAIFLPSSLALLPCCP